MPSRRQPAGLYLAQLAAVDAPWVAAAFPCRSQQAALGLKRLAAMCGALAVWGLL